MCGIIGYTGKEKAVPILLKGLDALSYRGYDSAGISVSGDGITTVKASGRIDKLVEKIENTVIDDGGCGIGHSRWATHGAPTDINAHPHSTPNLTLVHNGIIENYAEIGEELRGEGYEFVSETDTEIAACLIDKHYKATHDPRAAIFAATREIRGSYAFAVIFKDELSHIYAIRHDSPLIVARGADGAYAASDITALVGNASTYYRPDNGVLAVLADGGVSFFGADGKALKMPLFTIDWDVARAQRGGYAHFMIKEIHEEPESIRQTCRQYIKDGLPYFGETILTTEFVRGISRIRIIACGTAMNAGLIGKNFIEKIAAIPVSVEIASEFRYRKPIIHKDELVIFVSQSGETADTLAALRYVKSRGVPAISVVNVFGSTIACESDTVFYTYAGPEIAVASTKAYHVQCSVFCLLAAYMGMLSGNITTDEAARIAGVISCEIPEVVATVLESEAQSGEAARSIKDAENLFYIGRCMDYDIITEGSLKLKEISYIHSEAFAAGELKHGTISLITDNTPVIAVITEREVAEKTITGMREVGARGAKLIAVVSDYVDKNCAVEADIKIVLPETPEGFDVFPAVTVMQLIAYHTSVARGNDVDKPRNLAKSVTVE
ncbi:MAG: glutamine--fructose-6-phosphate transaminase (isomerizing) [Eubacteriales bacterium]